MTTWIVGAGGQDGTLLRARLTAINESLVLQYSKHIYFPNGSSMPIEGMSTHRAKEIIKAFHVKKIYFLAAHSRPSYVRKLEGRESSKSFRDIELLFESICKAVLGARWSIDIFLASSCLIYAGSNESPQNEWTIPVPLEMYAESKIRMSDILFEYSRKSSVIRPIVGIFYNHESTLRTKEYLSHKVINHALDICDGKKENTQLNLISGTNSLDLSHAEDFIHNVLELTKTDFSGNCIFSSGLSISIQFFCESVFDLLGLDYRNFVSFSDDNTSGERKTILLGNNELLRRSISRPRISTPIETITRLVKEWQEKRRY